MGALRINFEVSQDDIIRQVRAQIDHAQFLNLEWLLTFGFDKEQDNEKFYHAMTQAQTKQSSGLCGRKERVCRRLP